VEENSRRRFARYVHVKNWNLLFYCSNIAKSENAMLWWMLSRLETCLVYKSKFQFLTCTYLAKRLCEFSSTKTGSYPHEFLCRTDCSACVDYQPWYDDSDKCELLNKYFTYIFYFILSYLNITNNIICSILNFGKVFIFFV
jgi:hypothetical protein